MRVQTVIAAIALGAGVALGAAGCAGDTRYEDCEVDDQYVDGDTIVRAQTYESDCGYWEQNGEYFLREALVAGATWHWYTWVTPGKPSFAPEGWKPPHGLKPPKESSESRKRREKHEKSTSTSTRPTPAATRKTIGGGTGGIDGRDRRNAPAAPAAPRPRPRG